MSCDEAMFQLTLDPPTADWLRAYYRDLSGVILEYGSGGSSVLALRSNRGNQLYSCETDSLWLARLSSFLTEEGLSERFHPLHCDVGPTKQWCYPDFTHADFTHDRGTQFLLAAWKPWSMLRAQKINPDFVLIDGRWRVPSFLSAVIGVRLRSRFCLMIILSVSTTTVESIQTADPDDWSCSII